MSEERVATVLLALMSVAVVVVSVLWRRAMGVVVAAAGLIDFVMEKYGVKTLDDFTCPLHRKLAQALGKGEETPVSAEGLNQPWPTEAQIQAARMFDFRGVPPMVFAYNGDLRITNHANRTLVVIHPDGTSVESEEGYSAKGEKR